MSKKSIQLGWRVKDIVSSFEGIAETRLESIDGSVDIGIRPGASKSESTIPQLQYLAENRLQKVDDGINIAPVERRFGFQGDV